MGTTIHETFICEANILVATDHATDIKLHYSMAYLVAQSSIFAASFGANQRCLGAVDNIVALGNLAMKSSKLTKLGPLFAFNIWVGARVLLIYCLTVENKISLEVQLFMGILRGVGKTWHISRRYAAMLQLALEEYGGLDATSNYGNETTILSLSILTDTRHCVYELECLALGHDIIEECVI